MNRALATLRFQCLRGVMARRFSSATQAQASPLTPPGIEGQEKVYPAHIEGIVQSISKLTLLEVADLNELLTKRLNIKVY